MPKTILIQLPDPLYEKVLKFIETEKKNLNDWIIGLMQESIQKKDYFASESSFYQKQLSFGEKPIEPPEPASPLNGTFS